MVINAVLQIFPVACPWGNGKIVPPSPLRLDKPMGLVLVNELGKTMAPFMLWAREFNFQYNMFQSFLSLGQSDPLDMVGAPSTEFWRTKVPGLKWTYKHMRRNAVLFRALRFKSC